MIPSTLTEEQLWTALKPFFDLLDVTPFHVYDNGPQVQRDEDGSLHVRFQHVVDPDGPPMDWPVGTTGDDKHAEKTYEVDIAVRHDQSLDALWPDAKPASTLVGGEV